MSKVEATPIRQETRSIGVRATLLVTGSALALAACTVGGNQARNNHKPTVPAKVPGSSAHYGTPKQMELTAQALSRGYGCTIEKIVNSEDVRVVLSRTPAAVALMKQYGKAHIAEASEPAIQAIPKKYIENGQVGSLVLHLAKLGDNDNYALDGGTEDFSGKKDARLLGPAVTDSYVVFARTEAETLDGHTNYKVISYVPCGEVAYNEKADTWSVAKHEVSADEALLNTVQHAQHELSTQPTFEDN